MEAIEEPTGGEVEAGAEELVLGWRQEELVAAGYEAGGPLLLAAHTELDLHLRRRAATARLPAQDSAPHPALTTRVDQSKSPSALPPGRSS